MVFDRHELGRRTAWGLALGLADAGLALMHTPLPPAAPVQLVATTCAIWIGVAWVIAPQKRDHGPYAASLVVAVLLLALLPATGPLEQWLTVALTVTAFVIASVIPIAGRWRMGVIAAGLIGSAVLVAWRVPPPMPVPPASDRPQVLLVTVDTWRADSRSSAHHALQPGLMPFTDALAENGCAPAPAFSTAPLTGPSHAAMLSGTHPIDLGLLLNAREVPDVRMLAEDFAAAGYRTEAYLSSAMLSGELGYDRGFDLYEDDLDGRRLLRATVIGPLLGPADPAVAFERDGPDTLARMAVAASVDAPLFVWVHLYDPHRPYTPTTKGVERAGDRHDLPAASAYDHHPVGPLPTRAGPGAALGSLHAELFGGTSDLPRDEAQRRDVTGSAATRSYLAEVADVDALIAHAFELFELRTGTPPDVWAVVGDHGESLTEHHELASHQRHLYRANTEVPLILSPGDCPTGPVSTIHLAGALRARAGLGSPPEWNGPIVSAVMGPAHGRVPPQMVPKVLLRQGDRELLVTLPPGGRTMEQYNLASDPHELHPLPPDPDLVDAIQPWLDTMRQTKSHDAADSMRDALEALGYVQ